jgi:dipeptidyl aminopeptidase/acylaminoacyl peptidase
LFNVPGYDVDSLISTPDQSAALGARYVANNGRTEWFDPVIKDVQRQLDERAGPGNATIVSWSQDKSKLLVAMGDASQAGGLYLWDRAVGIPTFLGWANSALKDRRLNPVKTIQYKAQDGTPIQAVLTVPRGQEAKNLPLIVMPHGGPGARDSESFDWWAQYLAEQGYAVIQPNYRGSTGFGTYFYRLGEGQMGRKMQDDLLDAISWASQAGIADAKRVCIVGGSYGGYAAMRAAQRDGSHYRCAISYAGVSDLNEMMKYDRAFLIGSNPKRYWKTLAPDFQEVSPRNHPTEFSVPILIMHGAKDKRVPVKQSRAMVAALTKAGKPVTYIEQRLGDHHFTRPEDRLEFLQSMKVFLDKYNPAS